MRLRRKTFMIDASVIPLYLNMFDWAFYRKQKGALKLHLMLDYDGCIPVFAYLTLGKVHEINIARNMGYPKGSVLVFDRGYIDYEWLNNLDSNKIFYVTRAKENMEFWHLDEVGNSSRPNDNIKEYYCIELTGYKASQQYPQKLCRVVYWDEEQQKNLVFITNNFSWTAQTVADIYKERWSIEIFFKHIKQNLKIKSFIGTSFNVVMIQLWTALISMLLLTYLKSKAGFNWHLSNLITFIRMNLFSKIELFKWLDNPFIKKTVVNQWQLDLFSG